MLRAWVRRGLASPLPLQRRGVSSPTGGLKPTSVKDYDEAKYGGWKSAQMLFTEEPAHKSLIGRWDWHVVQFLLALIPPGMVWLLVQWARYDMRKMEERREKEALAMESEKLAAVIKHQQSSGGGGGGSSEAAAALAGSVAAPAAGADGSGSGEELQRRLTRLEAAVQQLLAQQAAQGPQAAGAAAQQQQQGRSQPQAAPASAQQAQQGQGPQASAPTQQPGQQAAAQEGEQGQQQAAARSLMQRLRAPWQWMGSRLGGGRASTSPQETAGAADREPAAGTICSSSGGSSSGGSSSGGSSSGGSSSGGSSSLVASHSSGGSSSLVASHSSGVAAPAGQEASGAAQLPAAGDASSRGGPAGAWAEGGHVGALQQAPGQQPAPHSRAPPASTAQWLLHAMGQPLRWLKHQAAGPPGDTPQGIAPSSHTSQCTGPPDNTST